MKHCKKFAGAKVIAARSYSVRQEEWDSGVSDHGVYGWDGYEAL